MLLCAQANELLCAQAHELLCAQAHELLCAQANELEDQLDTAQDEQERLKDLWEKSAASYKDSERLCHSCADGAFLSGTAVFFHSCWLC